MDPNMEETNDGVSTVRETLRRDWLAVRHRQRSLLLGQSRRLDESNSTSSVEDMKNLAASIRKRGSINSHLLQQIQHNLLLGPEYVSAFLSTNGALVSLIRALSGLNPTLKNRAANCLCNLALSDEKTIFKITKQASTYLLIEMESSNPILQDACTWTIGNLSAGSSEAWDLLHSQGALSKILHLIGSPHANVRESAVYSVTHYVEHGLERLQILEVKNVIDACAPLLPEHSLAYLFFLLSCRSQCDTIMMTARVPHLALSKLALLLHSPDLTKIDVVCELTYLLRMLGNLCADQCECAQLISATFGNNSGIVKILLNNCKVPSHINDETLWLIANIFQYESYLDQRFLNISV
jgi:hypothetical protein